MDYILFLDDIRLPQQASVNGIKLSEVSGFQDSNWHIVRSFEDFVHTIKTRGVPRVVSFDHDLTDEHVIYFIEIASKTGIFDYSKVKGETGLHCAVFLKNFCEGNNKDIPPYFVHSANYIGAENIKNFLK